jgi:hypothetical protein
MRDAYATKVRVPQAGKQKRCSYCGEYGHNRKTCAVLAEATGTAGAPVEEATDTAAGPDGAAPDADDQLERLVQLKQELAAVQLAAGAPAASSSTSTESGSGEAQVRTQRCACDCPFGAACFRASG